MSSKLYFMTALVGEKERIDIFHKRSEFNECEKYHTEIYQVTDQEISDCPQNQLAELHFDSIFKGP